MANIWEKATLILVGNLNSGLSYIITTVFGVKCTWKMVHTLVCVDTKSTACNPALHLVHKSEQIFALSGRPSWN